MDKLKLEKPYKGGLSASIDWVGGGNFDGFVYQNILIFSEDHTVKCRTIVLDQSRYDGEKENSELIGHYKETDHKTITCVFGNYIMRGKVLGNEGEYIAFSGSYPNFKQTYSECYQLSEE